ncbi:MAG: aquaporin, partial [Microbacteriaceae bacterium]|nr:aquaporin [Microbacteriaceae bacterium]
LVYWAAQILGGIVGGLILWATFKLSDFDLPAGFASNGFGTEGSPTGFNLASVALVEIVLTALLIMVVLATTHLNFPVGFGGLAAGGTLWLIHLISIPVSNTSVNPARSTATAIFAGGDYVIQLWAFWLAPIIGAVIAGATYSMITGVNREALDVSGEAEEARS